MQVICPERKRGGAHCQNAISYTPFSYLKLLINDECTDEEGLTRISVVLWLRRKPWSTKCELLLANIWRLQKWLHRERATKLTNLNVAERQLAGPQRHQTTEKAKPSQLAKWHEREDAEKFDLKHIFKRTLTSQSLFPHRTWRITGAWRPQSEPPPSRRRSFLLWNLRMYQSCWCLIHLPLTLQVPAGRIDTLNDFSSLHYASSLLLFLLCCI